MDTNDLIMNEDGEMMDAAARNKRLAELIVSGVKKNGGNEVSYDEVNEFLRERDYNSDDIDEIYDEIEKQGLEIVKFKVDDRLSSDDEMEVDISFGLDFEDPDDIDLLASAEDNDEEDERNS